MNARSIVRGAACLICCVLLVLLVPSSAWSATGERGSSALSVPSLVGPGSSLADPEGEPTDEPTDEPEPGEPTATVTATETVTQTVVEQGEAVCGSGDLPPCQIALPVETEAWGLLAAGLGVALLGALLVTTWGNAGD